MLFSGLIQFLEFHIGRSGHSTASREDKKGHGRGEDLDTHSSVGIQGFVCHAKQPAFPPAWCCNAGRDAKASTGFPHMVCHRYRQVRPTKPASAATSVSLWTRSGWPLFLLQQRMAPIAPAFTFQFWNDAAAIVTSKKSSDTPRALSSTAVAFATASTTVAGLQHLRRLRASTHRIARSFKTRHWLN